MDAPELRVLRYFVAVAEHLHFGQAAKALHISQPSLSVQIRKLERQLHVQLLERTSRAVSLTAAGETLLTESRSLLAQADQLVRAVGALPRSRRRLVVGFQANAAAELTPRIMEAFRAAHPDVEVVIRSHDLADPYVGLTGEDVDVAFLRKAGPGPDWLRTASLFVEPRLIAFLDDSPLSAFAGTVPFEAVVDLPFVARNGPDFWRDYWLAMDSRGSAGVRVGAEVTMLEECFEAVSLGRAVSFTQASTARFFARPGISYRPVESLSPSTLAVGWRSDNETELTAQFVGIARDVAGEGLTVRP